MKKAQLSKEDEKTLIEKVKEFGVETIFGTINLETLLGINTTLEDSKIQVYGLAAPTTGITETLQVCFWVFADGYENEATDCGFCNYNEIEADVFDKLLNTLLDIPEEPKKVTFIMTPKIKLPIVTRLITKATNQLMVCISSLPKRITLKKSSPIIKRNKFIGVC